MSQMKQLAEYVSERLGKDGEIDDQVLASGRQLLEESNVALEKLCEIAERYGGICRVHYRPPTADEPQDDMILAISGDGLLQWKCSVQVMSGDGQFTVLDINEHGDDGPWLQRFNACGLLDPNIALTQKRTKNEWIGQKADIHFLEQVLEMGTQWH